jgi:hypothetical protein
LNAGIGEVFVIEGFDFEGAAQFEVADGAVGPDQEGVVFYRVGIAGLADNCAVFDGPESRVTVPAGEIFAVEDGSEGSFATERNSNEQVGVGGVREQSEGASDRCSKSELAQPFQG